MVPSGGFVGEAGREVSEGGHREESLKRRSVGGPQVCCRGSGTSEGKVGGGSRIPGGGFRVGPES